MKDIGHTIRRKLLAGFLAITPIALTIYILKITFIFLDNLTAPILQKFNIWIPGLGIILTLLILFLLGVIVTNVLGRTLLNIGEEMVGRIPLVKSIYTTVKQITQAFSRGKERSFRDVVYIEYPRIGILTLAFVTGESSNEEGIVYYHLFVPTTPNPTSGVFIMVPKDDTMPAGMPIEMGLKTIISGGMLAPKKHKAGSKTKAQEKP